MTSPKVSPKQVEAVFRLPPDKRYVRFIKQLADWKVAWGLADADGWTLFGDQDQGEYLPLWPAREYAAACQSDQWQGATPREIALDELLGSLLPSLREAERRIAVFPAPDSTFVAPELDTIAQDVQRELEEWY